MPKVNYRQVDVSSPAVTGLAGWFADRPQMPYLLPFFAFVACMAPATFGKWGGIDWAALWHREQPAVYTVKTVVAAVLLWAFWRYFAKIRWTHLGVGAAVGLFGTVLWVGTEYVSQRLGIGSSAPAATLYNPDLMLDTQWQRWLFLCIRVVGPTLVVPVMEELFFRDFLMRALVRGARYDDVPVGTFTWFSLLGMSVLFGVNHGGQWPEGILYGLLMGVLLIRTRSLGSCIVAHAVTNWTLYLYVIYSGDWQFM